MGVAAGKLPKLLVGYNNSFKHRLVSNHSDNSEYGI